jgi:molybdopterin-containing oxidoreductase family molybdopterin binding subunit
VAFRQNIEAWTPERAEAITTVPAATIRRLAHELADAAQIGQTIELEGDTYPLRPASVTWYRGISAHRHAMLTGMAMGQLNMLLGAVDVPGGILNSASAGPSWQPTTDPDGLLIPNNPYMGAMLGSLPRRKVRPPETLQLIELFPLSVYGHSWLGLLRGEELGLDYGAEVLIQSRGNIVATAGDPEAMAAALRRIPFVCSINPFVDETTQFADLVLPDTHSLERLVPLVANPYAFYTSAAQPNERYTWNFQQPVVKAVPAARHWGEVMLDVAERLGIAPDLYTAFNGVVHLSDDYRLRRDHHYSWEEIADVWARSVCGDEHGLEYFKQHGYYTGEARTARTSYPLPFHGARLPLYLEHFIDAGGMVRDYTASRGVAWDTADYMPLVDWKPCLTEEQSPAQFDLWLVNQKLPFMTFSFSAENPMLVDLAKRSTKVYNVGINTATAARKGIADGDRVVLETPDGRRVEGTARTSEGIHPDCLAVPGVLGRWAVGNPGARGQGVHVNGLLTYTLDHMDTLSAALDSCVKVRISRVG